MEQRIINCKGNGMKRLWAKVTSFFRICQQYLENPQKQSVDIVQNLSTVTRKSTEILSLCGSEFVYST